METKSVTLSRWPHTPTYRPTPLYALTTVDGDECRIALGDFAAANPDVDLAPIRALGVGQEYSDGGGAAPEWTIRRVR